MNTPLPLPFFNIVSALAGHAGRRPSNAPAAANWLLNPTMQRTSLDEREESVQKLLNFLYSCFPPGLVAIWKAEADGLSPSSALQLFSSHLDDRYPEFF